MGIVRRWCTGRSQRWNPQGLPLTEWGKPWEGEVTVRECSSLSTGWMAVFFPRRDIQEEEQVSVGEWSIFIGGASMSTPGRATSGPLTLLSHYGHLWMTWELDTPSPSVLKTMTMFFKSQISKWVGTWPVYLKYERAPLHSSSYL